MLLSSSNSQLKAQWLARWSRDPAIVCSIPTTLHVAIVISKQFTDIFPQSTHLVPDKRQKAAEIIIFIIIANNLRQIGSDIVML